MLLGFQANKIRTKILPKKNLAKGYQKLEAMMMSLWQMRLCQPDSYVWGNIFSPCELIRCFGLKTLSIECLSCYLSGYHLEDYFNDYAQNTGDRAYALLLSQDFCRSHLTATQYRCRTTRLLRLFPATGI